MDPKYKHPGDVKSVWKHTSKWRYVQIEILRARYINVDNIVEAEELDTVELSPLADTIMLSTVEDVQNPPSDLTLPQRIFRNHLRQISTTFRDKPPVGLVANDLLTFSGYEDDVLHFRPKPHLERFLNGFMVSSEPDYGVYSECSRAGRYAEYFVVVEDKARMGSTSIKNECQLYGEMLIAAMYRYGNVRMQKIVVYGLVLRGLRMRFYEASFDAGYLESLINEEKPKEDVLIKRYPPDTERELSLLVRDQRLKAIKVMSAIRTRVKLLVSS